MKQIIRITLTFISLYVIYLTVISAYYYITYSHNSYFYNEYFDGSERKQASAYKSLVSIIKRSNDLIGVVEQINDNKLVKTSLTYYKFNSDKSKVIESYGICIYMFKL